MNMKNRKDKNRKNKNNKIIGNINDEKNGKKVINGKIKFNSIWICIILSIVLLTLEGCGSKNKSTDKYIKQNTENTVSLSEKAGSSEGYLFKSNGVSIGVDMDMDLMAQELGEPKSIYEQPSCAAQGTAYLYRYSGFEINTYPDGNKNYISYIILKDDTVSTPEGINLSKTKTDIINVYGEDYIEEESKITYKKGNMKLNFILDGNNITSIEYASGVLN